MTGSRIDTQPTPTLSTRELTKDDMARFAAQQPLVSPVGQWWHYSSGSYAILSRVLRPRSASRRP